MVPDSQSVAVNNGGNHGHGGSEREKEADTGDILDAHTAFRPSVDTPLSSYSDMWRCAAIFGYVRRHMHCIYPSAKCVYNVDASRHTSVNPRNALGTAMQYRAFKLFNAVSMLVYMYTWVDRGAHRPFVYGRRKKQ
ncbi:hypothetical protein K438DRAFT_1777199 [Mycena galopus ATCC 62051]|nr:hypothetical protein K438DRAFT_1777199 [Mycena galopus ATCC 62051]